MRYEKSRRTHLENKCTRMSTVGLGFLFLNKTEAACSERTRYIARENVTVSSPLWDAWGWLVCYRNMSTVWWQCPYAHRENHVLGKFKLRSSKCIPVPRNLYAVKVSFHQCIIYTVITKTTTKLSIPCCNLAGSKFSNFTYWIWSMRDMRNAWNKLFRNLKDEATWET
jgi:hypothetical protein